MGATILPNPNEPVTINHPIFGDLVASLQECLRRTEALAQVVAEIAQVLGGAGLLGVEEPTVEDQELENVDQQGLADERLLTKQAEEIAELKSELADG